MRKMDAEHAGEPIDAAGTTSRDRQAQSLSPLPWYTCTNRPLRKQGLFVAKSLKRRGGRGKD